MVEEIEKRLQEGLLKLIERAAPRPQKESRGVKLTISRLKSCPRQLIFDFVSEVADAYEGIDEEQQPTGKGWGVLVAGIWWEEFVAQYVLQDYHRQCGVILEDVPGHCDFLRHEPDGTVKIVECKTRYELPDKPLPSHLVQIKAYVLGVLENGYQLPDGQWVKENIHKVKGCLLYLNRDNPNDHILFKVEEDPSIKVFVREMVQYVRDFEENGVIPPIPKEFHPFKFPCFIETRYEARLCPYHHLCWRQSLVRKDEKMQETQPLLQEAFRRWLEMKEKTQDYERFMDTLVRPLWKDITATISVEVEYLGEKGIFRAVPRRGPSRVDINILRRQIEKLLGREFSDDEWHEICQEATVEGKPTIALEFRRITR